MVPFSYYINFVCRPAVCNAVKAVRKLSDYPYPSFRPGTLISRIDTTNVECIMMCDTNWLFVICTIHWHNGTIAQPA